MRQLLLILLATFSFGDNFAQTMTSIFKQLPAECTPQLSVKERDILLSKGEYILPGGDSTVTVKYSIDTSATKDYLRFEYNFTTGQSGFIAFELRRFKKENGKSFILFSRCGGLRHNYYQHELRVFDIENNRLQENYAQTLLPKSVNISNLLKEQTPDAIKTKIEQAVSSCYNLYSEMENQIEWTISPEYSQEYEQFILAYTLTFTWTGNVFERKLKIEN